MDQLAALLVIPVLAVIAVITLFRLGVLGKKMLPLLPESGALPVAELAKYYDRDSPVAWERVRGWELNQPIDLNGPAPIDHVCARPAASRRQAQQRSPAGPRVTSF
jgi:hypothetical protein